MRTKWVILLVLCLFVAGGYIAFHAVHAQTRNDSSQQIESLLREFLNGAGTNDAAMHDRFCGR